MGRHSVEVYVERRRLVTMFQFIKVLAWIALVLSAVMFILNCPDDGFKEYIKLNVKRSDRWIVKEVGLDFG